MKFREALATVGLPSRPLTKEQRSSIECWVFKVSLAEYFCTENEDIRRLPRSTWPFSTGSLGETGDQAVAMLYCVSENASRAETWSLKLTCRCPQSPLLPWRTEVQIGRHRPQCFFLYGRRHHNSCDTRLDWQDADWYTRTENCYTELGKDPPHDYSLSEDIGYVEAILVLAVSKNVSLDHTTDVEVCRCILSAHLDSA